MQDDAASQALVNWVNTSDSILGESESLDFPINLNSTQVTRSDLPVLSVMMLNLHLGKGEIWLGHLVATLDHLVEPGVHGHAGVGALA